MSFFKRLKGLRSFSLKSELVHGIALEVGVIYNQMPPPIFLVIN
jgi:hypothetical protein